ncbi:MAG: class III poly(R)-hydroxyalkanoic acid synthase subunit PhaC [Fluviicola sp.]|jgi:polyhydroxyalkanoate synthase|nr:class III poly(R)-hydroxyalkanoic acid synthase subunit PhaC [Fluviicola sp.]
MKLNNIDILQELSANTSKIVKGIETLNEIKEVEIAITPKTLVFQDEKVKLFRYNRDSKATYKTPVLIVYALVNTYQMLDLQPDRSYIKNLLEAGLDVYLIDWGYPTKMDKYLSMDDYINGYIDNCVDFVRTENKVDKINILSICQGGTFSLIYSALHSEKIKNLVTHVTPVDFSINDGLLFKWSKEMDFKAVVAGFDGIVPGSFLNEGFEMLKPMMKFHKSSGLMNSLEDKTKLTNYLRMEKWISDSPDQAGACFLQFMEDLYQQNKLIKGELVVGEHKVNLKNLNMPVLNIYASEDHLVPPTATTPLGDYVGTKDYEVYRFEGGHIGVFVGNRSQKELAPKVANWLKDRD